MQDVAIIGAGPVGLSFAIALAGSGLSTTLIERQPAEALENPAFDGREIALTHHSRALLESLGAWTRIPANAVSPLREARVLNGTASYALTFDTGAEGTEALGFLVSNHLIRRALHQVAQSIPTIRILAGTGVDRVATTSDCARLRLSDGQEITARLAIAADTRFSRSRAQLGIAASTLDFQRSMLVCRMAHEAPHGHVATEWFDYGQTIALLPVNGDASSLVITRSHAEITRLKNLPAAEFEAEMAESLRQRNLGPIRLASTRHAYPLVATYARRFIARRFALLGDAAVGMHPVTAHGFNLGLRGAETLAREILSAQQRGRDIAAPEALGRYEAAHRLATGPLYAGTNALARLYAEESPPARLLRHAVLRAGGVLSPFRKAVASMLMDRGSRAA
ncbi:Ubiquinone biosynthesis hydroxylase, UbiH/UbiF/VisC/COQ6 family [Roseomonas rosea]|uniref:Ubiquinone biosynthesis hydroxylase, UbiH/UbiF/VisC/COQ6 family n=1 Tax=Muricoccus roseus TaxID=198092 RepID=A0A1M6Q669_9PROT|nr:5-demethoxyubiquinol-8 5-hydroxylase UbiM [Roseomonas rosea]SHK15779.1 Ubiquinone biosynthesis hydroxylase, UbiH/UbiF/VisC/COQ6 family [Roseomonas rosea]